MLKIGLTGGIGSGKTTVAKVFALLGVPVYYADDASKRLYHTDANLKKQIKEAFGESIYTGDVLNRSALASAVFGNPERLALLNSLVHPPTIKDAEDWMKAQTAPYIIKEAALLFESGSHASLDFVIGVSAPKALRVKRTQARDKSTEAEVEHRIARQIKEDEKMKRCDFIITNDETRLVIPQVLALHNQFLNRTKEKQSAAN